MAIDISHPPVGPFCVACLMENLARRTSDATALSDVRRIHRAYHRGHDTTRVGTRGPVRVGLPLKPTLIDLDDVNHWFETVGALMRPTTLDVYTSTYARALEGLDCHHSGASSGAPGTSMPRATSDQLAQGEVLPRDVSGFTSAGPSTGRTGFKLSVAQKCLSLALKHAYARGVIGPATGVPGGPYRLERGVERHGPPVANQLDGRQLDRGIRPPSRASERGCRIPRPCGLGASQIRAVDRRCSKLGGQRGQGAPP